MFQYRQVLVRLRQGDGDREIARSGLMGRVKVARLRALAAAHGWLAPDRPLPEDAELAAAMGQARRARSTVSSAEPYRALVLRWREQGVSGVAIHAALCREHGYPGSYSSIHRLIASLERARPPKATVPLSFAPGAAAQVDFGAGPLLIDAADGRVKRTWCFVMTLCYSRHQYVEFVFDQKAATWLGLHRRAFEWFGAVPERLIIDNPRCAITRACSRDPVVQRAYAECAEGYGFRIEPCPPADPAKKGIVEAGVKYVKGNFLPTRQFRDLTDLNAEAREWVLLEAGVRVHGTTREQPLERFAVEKPLMRPLPDIAPDLGVWARVRVHRDCHVQFEKVLYSVPFTLVGRDLWLRATDTAVTVYADHRQVALHIRARAPGARQTSSAHLPPAARVFFAHDRQWCLARAAQIGPACRELIQTLLTDRIVERLRAAQGVLRLAEQFDPQRLEAACTRALAHAAPHYRTVKTILARGFDRSGDRDTHPDAFRASTYAPHARFARDAGHLFAAAEPPPATAHRALAPVFGGTQGPGQSPIVAPARSCAADFPPDEPECPVAGSTRRPTQPQQPKETLS